MKNRSKRIRRRKTQPQTSLAFNKLVQLRNLFDANQWEIEEGTEISFFDRYVRTLTGLKEHQQDFMLSLSKRFLHIPQSMYLENLVNPIKRLREIYPNKTLIFAACLKKEDIGKIKSSTTVLYQLKGTTIKSKVNIGKYIIVDELNADTANRLNLSDAQIVLVDDFVGTGETASNAAAYVRELLPIVKNEHICILSIVAMQNGRDALEYQGIKVFNRITCQRGISDYYSGQQLHSAKTEMEGIERTLRGLKPVFRFGFKQSEALVCMERCPNNTFPIYWLTKGVAPYER